MKRSIGVMTMVVALAGSAVAPAIANDHDNRGRGGQAAATRSAGSAESVIGQYGDCAAVTALSQGRSGLLTGLRWENDCGDRWLEALVTACLPNGTRTEYVRIFTEADVTLDQRTLRQVGLRPATRFATYPGSVGGWDELPPLENYLGGYYVIDADGNVQDHTREREYPRMAEEEIVSGDASGNHFLARTHPRTGTITEFEFVNTSDSVGHFLFELRYRNGTYSQVFVVQTAPHSTVVMGRGEMARLGIRDAVGVGDRLTEFGDYTEGATHFDADGTVTQWQDRRDVANCPGNIT